MPEQPLVSVIVPIYNAQDHIARCVESIRRQTYKNLEILLLNDGSKDVSLEVCKMYANVDPRIVLIDKANSGVAATRNMGLREARGKYLQFVDADDTIQPYATELLVQRAPLQIYELTDPPELWNIYLLRSQRSQTRSVCALGQLLLPGGNGLHHGNFLLLL